MLKSQKCSRWETEGEREETLQKLQVRMADLGHLCTQSRGIRPHFWEPKSECRRAAMPLSASG